MICRIWHGWTSLAQSASYQHLLIDEIFPGIRARKIRGFLGIELLRRDSEQEVEFVTIMWFDSLDAVRDFAGPGYEAAVVPPKARALLTRYDEQSQHYEVEASFIRDNAHG